MRRDCGSSWWMSPPRRCATRSGTITGRWKDAACCWTSGPRPAICCFLRRGRSMRGASPSGPIPSRRISAMRPRLRFPEAEAAKLEKGSVSLGGAYEEPEDPQAAAIAKIARQVMTRLHIQVNQTIQFYRGPAGRFGAGTALSVRRGFDHALHGAVFCRKAQSAGGLLQSLP